MPLEVTAAAIEVDHDNPRADRPYAARQGVTFEVPGSPEWFLAEGSFAEFRHTRADGLEGTVVVAGEAHRRIGELEESYRTGTPIVGRCSLRSTGS